MKHVRGVCDASTVKISSKSCFAASVHRAKFEMVPRDVFFERTVLADGAGCTHAVSKRCKEDGWGKLEFQGDEEINSLPLLFQRKARDGSAAVAELGWKGGGIQWWEI